MDKIILQVFGWTIGILFSSIGVINMFWGNDPLFGVFIFGLSLIYFPPIQIICKKITGFNISLGVKIIVGLFIVWSSLGVGELFDKIELMINYFNN